MDRALEFPWGLGQKAQLEFSQRVQLFYKKPADLRASQSADHIVNCEKHPRKTVECFGWGTNNVNCSIVNKGDLYQIRTLLSKIRYSMFVELAEQDLACIFYAWGAPDIKLVPSRDFNPLKQLTSNYWGWYRHLEWRAISLRQVISW